MKHSEPEDDASETDHIDYGANDIVHAIVLAVVEDLGPDISHVRLAHLQPSEKLYLTGIDVGLVIGAGVLSAFLVGVAKGVAEGLGKEGGKRAAASIVDRLDGLRSQIAELLREDTTDFRAEYGRMEGSIADVQSELLREHSEEFTEIIETTTAQQNSEVVGELRKYGFAERSIARHSVKVVRTIRHTWKEQK
jgi:hypothetical protein